MNLQSFELLKEDADCYHVGHPNGKAIAVKKSGLSKKAHEVIQKLKSQKMAKGGKVKEEPPVNPISQSFMDATGWGAIKPQPASSNPLPANYADGTVDVEPQDAPARDIATEDKTGELFSGLKDKASQFFNFLNTPITPEAIAAETPAQPLASNAPVAPPPTAPINPAAQAPENAQPLPTSPSYINSGLGNYRNAVQNATNAEVQMANKSADAYNVALQGMGEPEDVMGQQEFLQADIDRRRQRDEELFNAYAEKKIDPDRYWHDKSTGSKILAAASIAFGAIGSAMAGVPNYAQENITNAINRDIEAQKNDQSKGFNLYKMNREALGSDLAAKLQTQNQMFTIAKLKVQQAAAVASGPMAAAKGAELMTSLDQMIAKNNLRIALTQGGKNIAPGSIKADPTMFVDDLVPPENRKEVTDEIKQAATAKQSKNTLMGLFDQAAKEQTIMKTGFGMARTSGALKSLGLEIIPVLRDAAGKVSDTEMHSAAQVFPAAGDSEHTIETKRRAFENLLEKKSIAPTAKRYGIDLDKFDLTSLNPMAGFTAKQREFYDWAKANPNDPKAALTLQKLGVK